MKRNKLEEIAKILIEKDEEEKEPSSNGLLNNINEINEKLNRLERIFGTVEKTTKEPEKKLSPLEDLKRGIENLVDRPKEGEQ